MAYPSERLAILIDGQALSSLSYGLGIKIDYRKLKTYFAKSAKLAAIKYYAVIPADRVENPYVKLLDWLDYNGYRIHRKFSRIFEDEEGGRTVKGNVTVDLSVDLLLMARHVDHIVLIGAHGDYAYPVAQAQRLGTRVTLLSSLKADAMRPADELRRVADEFIELDDLYDEISLPDLERTAAE